jgi:hypothetical protein
VNYTPSELEEMVKASGLQPITRQFDFAFPCGHQNTMTVMVPAQGPDHAGLDEAFAQAVSDHWQAAYKNGWEQPCPKCVGP